MTAEIEAFSLGWHQQQGCVIRIKQKGKNDWDVIKASAAEFCAIASLLRLERMDTYRPGADRRLRLLRSASIITNFMESHHERHLDL